MVSSNLFVAVILPALALAAPRPVPVSNDSSGKTTVVCTSEFQQFIDTNKQNIVEISSYIWGSDMSSAPYSQLGSDGGQGWISFKSSGSTDQGFSGNLSVNAGLDFHDPSKYLQITYSKAPAPGANGDTLKYVYTHGMDSGEIIFDSDWKEASAADVKSNAAKAFVRTGRTVIDCRLNGPNAQGPVNEDGPVVNGQPRESR